MQRRPSSRLVFALGIATFVCPLVAHAEPAVSFERKDDRLDIRIDGKPRGEYVWGDRTILRPYFSSLRAPNGIQVTRRNPPVEGQDAVDHANMHPGLWLAFGDFAGSDFWRNKGTVRHVEFVEPPASDGRTGSFAVRNQYVAGDKTLCEEVCRIVIRAQSNGTLLTWDSQFSGKDELAFDDQEEMGLGVRVATPITVKNGGTILNSDGLKNEPQVWGKQSDWCDYSGTIDGQPVGILLMPDPKNFRRSWFHSRDYGVLVANPFGRKAFTKGEKSLVVVKPGESFRLRFGILVHSGATDLPAAYSEWVKSLKP
jgi:hypothetical protein